MSAPAEKATEFARDVDYERVLADLATSHVAQATQAMRTLAQSRAHDGPVKLERRSFRTEAREELADALNYVVWGHQAGEFSDAQVREVVTALALAWAALDGGRLADD